MLRTALTLTLTLATATIGASIAQADVYKYTDDKGNVLYTDKPSTLPAQRLDVRTQKTDVVAVQARQEAEAKRQESADRARQQGATAANDKREAAQLNEKDKAERCTKARERYDKYMNSRRLFETMPNEERRYLSDAELDAARASAKESMETLCK